MNGSCQGGTCGPWTTGPSTNGGGELTCYWFSQGTSTGDGCPSYKTYCGHCGTESGGGGGVCPSGISNSVSNISTGTYFAAFDGPGGPFANGVYCGMCVDVTFGGKTITATVVDACATCNHVNHIDLSLSASIALGLGQGQTPGNVTGVTWKSVACPVAGNIVAVYNNGYTGQVYFQNVRYPVASARTSNRTATQMYGFWDFGTQVAGQSVTLTDAAGHSITGTLPNSSGQSIGAQFCP
jgi:hypothetical protein